MYTLNDIIDLFNESTVVIIYDGNHEKVNYYDGRESIPEVFNDFVVNDIFADWLDVKHGTVTAIGIELEFYSEWDGQESEVF